ncbi:MAG: hypothetical protein NDJ10_06565 [Rhodoferax sp.]|nr:hypothetical protein [Rhodoferax sp.]
MRLAGARRRPGGVFSRVPRCRPGAQGHLG